ncbi:MAG: UDP-N-acetylmuramate dehydrogenase [Patescibacteria group bacterium]
MDIQEGIPLAPLSSFKIGGTARFFCEAKTVVEVREAVAWAKEKKLPLLVLGGGTNILMGDRGWSGLALKMEITRLRFDGNSVRVGAGVSWMILLAEAAKHSLAHLEWGAGIPGTVGGAVRGNAGAYGHSIGEFITEVETFSAAKGDLQNFRHEECAFRYRASFFKEHPEYIILGVSLALAPGNREVLETKMSEIIVIRNSKLPSEPSAGSVFKNIELRFDSQEEMLARIYDASEEERAQWKSYGKIPAGWLIEHCGFKDKKIGGAMVSPKHANTIINTGNARAEDVIMLTSLIKQKVRDMYDIELEEEVEFILG